MKKIPTIFERDWEQSKGRFVTDRVNPEAQWVFDGEGKATRKWDGVCVMIRDGKLYKRFEATPEHFSGKKTLPDTWEPADDKDETTGKQAGWVLVDEENGKPEDRYMLEALANTFGNRHRDGGTYEFVGPKSQGNVEGFIEHRLVKHGADVPGGGFGSSGIFHDDVPRTFDGLRGFLTNRGIEGIVFHHPDGRMAKIKARDFGVKR